MEYFAIEGGVELQGEIVPQGNKNEALPALCAGLLTEQPLTLTNVPAIKDIEVLADILKSVGAQIEPVGTSGEPDGGYRFENKGATIDSELDPELSAHLRGSVTLMGPLLARNGKVFLPRPGGDRIGRRRLDTHLLALGSLGADISVFNNGYRLETPSSGLHGADILLDEASVTATENAVMAASLAKGKTIIRNAASEPHVQGLCRLINKMGGNISGIGSNILEIEGVRELGAAEHTIGPDYLEIGSFISLGAVTGGNIRIRGVNKDDMRMILLVFEKLGIRIVWDEKDGALHDIIVPPNQRMKIQSDVHEAVGKIDDAPWPGFPADMTSTALVTATQCDGTILIHEKMFESRLFFVDKLIGMGARIVLCDPHRAVVIGPARLYGSKLTSPDIRAGFALLIAALAADGRSEIHNITQIDRGFQKLDSRLKKLGAKIERCPVE